jgi:hypothetical protein
MVVCDWIMNIIKYISTDIIMYSLPPSAFR